MSSRSEENLFTGPIGQEYELLRLICPNAALLARKLGDFVCEWQAGSQGAEYLRVFEIGCGTGISTLSLLASSERLRLIAVDSSAKMLDQARENLAEWVRKARVEFIEADALECLKQQPACSVDVIASNYAIHNFLRDYREDVVAEVSRVLRPGGLFINGDRYALDDRAQHLALTQSEVRKWFKTFAAMNRYDLLEDWIVHLFSDESPEHIMYLTPSLMQLRSAGLADVKIEYRDGVDTLVSAVKP